MKKLIVSALLALCMILPALPLSAQDAAYGDYRISGPYTHKNLSVYLVHGYDTVDAGDYMTLEEALDRKALRITETGSVSTLRVENISKNRKIFIQSGDIIRGGKQDRVIKHDLIINVNSGTVNINVYCVESGRWEKRGNENVQYFSSSEQKMPSKALKYAVSGAESQQDVWEEVEATQAKLERNVGAPVKADVSSSSLLLTLENKNVDKLASEYVREIESEVTGQRDVVGYIFAINGEINSGDIYGNRTLFEKLWPKLIKASAVEAVAESGSGARVNAPSTDRIASWLDSSDSGSSRRQELDGDNYTVVKESQTGLSTEAYEPSAPSEYIHKSVIKK